MSHKLRIWLTFLIFLNGYISLSLELVVLRQLSFWVGSSAVITSIIMGIFLGFMSIGYFIGSSEKIKIGKIKNILGLSFIVIALFAFFASSFPLVAEYFMQLYMWGITSSVIQTFIFSFIFLSVGPFLFGFNTTLLSRLLHKYNTNYTGNIMAWDTIGSVLGSLLTTLILMPFIGVNYTVMLIVLLASFAAMVTRPKLWVGLLCIAVIVPTCMINSDYVQQKAFGILVNNANSTISVSEQSNGDRVLYMNGLPMSIYNPVTKQGAEYINYINQHFIYNIPNDRKYKILVLGAGGFTAGLEDKYNEYVFVDIEHTLKDISENFFLNQKISPNKKFVVQDASQYLKNCKEKYDLILLDVYSNSFQVPEGFITAEFMQRVKSRVAENGILIMNIISSQSFQDRYSKVFDNTFHTVFPYNTQRQVIGYSDPWSYNDVSNILYVWYNRDIDERIYTINKTPVIYDRYIK